MTVYLNSEIFLISYLFIHDFSSFQTHWTCKTQYSKFIRTLVLQNLLSSITSLLKVFCRFSSLTIAYHNLGLNSSCLPFLVLMSTNVRPISHHTFLCIFHYSPFITKRILLETCMVCLVSLPLLSRHKDDLLSNIMRGYCSGITSESLFMISFFIILKCARDIPALHDVLYLLSVLDLATGPKICIKWPIGP